MADKRADRIKELTNTLGTGTVSLIGALQGYGRFSDAYADGEQMYYVISTGAEFETGYGTFQAAGNTLVRGSVRAKLEGGTYELNPATPLDIQAGAEVYADFTEEAWSLLIASIADLSGVQDPVAARGNLGFTDAILDKRSPGDIGAVTQGIGYFSRAQVLADADNFMDYRMAGDWGIIERTRTSGLAMLTIDPMPMDGTSLALIGMFRNTNTTGNCELRMYASDGSGVTHNRFGVSGLNSYFNGGGNLGIGTVTPETNLHVVGDINTKLTLERNDGYPAKWALQPYNNSFFIRDELAGAHRLVINAQGNCGIGTDLPYYKLHVEDTSASAEVCRFRNNTHANTHILVGSSFGGGRFGTYNNYPAILRDATNYAYYYDTIQHFSVLAGDVGIGTVSPGAKLDVRFHEASGYIYRGVNSTGSAIFQIWQTSGGDGHLFVRDGAGGLDIALRSNGQSFVNGNFGVGNTSPARELHVTGHVRFQNLPTSSAGLSAGDLWNDSGTLKIV